MSSTTTIDSSSGPLTDSEKTDIRRYMGFEAYGNGNIGFQPWLFFTSFGVLEFRLNNLSTSELVVIRSYIGTLQQLESAVLTAASNLDTASAAVWTRNPNEVADRQRLYAYQRRQLCSFLGIPPGAGLGDGVSRILI